MRDVFATLGGKRPACSRNLLYIRDDFHQNQFIKMGLQCITNLKDPGSYLWKHLYNRMFFFKTEKSKPTKLKTGSPFFIFLLLSERVFCKESIVIMKKFDFEIFTCLCVLRSPEFIYVIFMVIYACRRFCACACMHVSEQN